MNTHFRFFGRRIRDKVTGFTGVGTSLCFDLYGCVQTAITSPVNGDGAIGGSHWFDNNRLEIVDDSLVLDLPDFAIEKGPAIKPERIELPAR